MNRHPRRHGAGRAAQLAWLKVRAVDAADVVAHARFRRRLHRYLRATSIVAVASMQRIALIATRGDLTAIEAGFVVAWIARQPEVVLDDATQPFVPVVLGWPIRKESPS